ncbi:MULTISPECIES: AraC family transcriptional regulator [Vibrio]|jgi:AraC family transcriptional regulator|uniref:AraC family transcriptional regulator n=1 Tax=Vibrio splendidus TaxID=29497 RepID=A0A2G4B408_VIBSP|nr:MULTISPECIES: helix-turn-helix domain-containing protein [Vibrio]MBT9242266.1 AraC family transcriptional regulator [Vibrio splendidus]MCC4881583.1 AraC family transcriptional regulator [Vibrio splendidus]MCF7493836.1 AraC family transcriptional regulator [Vibrio sp. L5-1]MDH5902913.1 AraC family transcriptional regulator [Vibrio splendidus]MDH5938288.1 AraC family transcriptional regulator [Vibrio splendidus]|tara:strand:+ start:101 stop:1009 length:909 start_codon:yes stop_codon:yes gene_type:complete
MNTPAFGRISRVLTYIHSNLSSSLSLEDIATQSCWSRWQLQRVFQAETGLTVANYVRELKLSQAAEHLLDGKERVIDIALGLGFNSEISFSRSFKQMFGSSPSQYRKAGKRVGLRKPIQVSETASTSEKGALSFVEVRIDERESFLVKGMTSEISGLFSLTQDFAQKVPQLWSRLEGEVEIPDDNVLQFIGVVDLTQSCFDGTNIHYWAGVELQEGISIPQLPSIISERLEVLTVPKQTYAVVKHCGPIENLRHTLSWFVLNWMPSSGYRGVDGYELEVYPFAYQAHASDAEMEYWVPIIKS